MLARIATSGIAATSGHVEIAGIMGWSPEQVQKLLDRYVHRDAVLLAQIRQIEQVENENRKTGSKTGGGECG